VKNTITTKRVTFVIVAVFVILISSVSPLYVVNQIDWKFDPRKNKTLLGLVFTTNREQVEKISYVINNVFIPLTAFVIITVCTITLVIKLHRTVKWRQMSIADSQTDNVTTRNQRVAKMVVMISSLFIACFLPFSFIFIAMSLDPDLSLSGKHIKTLIIIGGLGFFLESVNSSVNIFIYYSMSSRFRETCRSLFRINSHGQ
ncbi:unnamed protein product, partial [Candidula unifasciata]